MSPELLNVVKERLNLGYSDGQIQEELRQAGYDDSTITAVLSEAKGSPVGNVPAPVAQSATLPGVFGLVESSIKYIFSRIDLWLLVAAPSLLIVLLEYFQQKSGVTATFSIVSLLATLVAIYFTLTAVYVVGVSAQRKASLIEGFQWVKSNGLAIIWIGILTGMATLGGSLLLIIPGIIVSVYLVLSYFTFVKEGHRGLDALMRSRELIYGNWLPVFGRLLGVGILFIVIFLIIVFAVSLITLSSGEAGVIVSTVLASLVQTAFSIAGMYIAVSIYDSLQTAKPTYQPDQHTSARKKYKGLAWLGLFFPVLIIFIAIVLASLNDARERGREAIERQQESHQESQEYLEMIMEEAVENLEY